MNNKVAAACKFEVDLLYKHVLDQHTHDISTKVLGPIALLCVQVSFVASTLVGLIWRLT